MADPIPDTQDKTKKDKSKQQRMLIIIGVVGLILTYVMLKKMSANNSSSGTTQSSTAGTTDDTADSSLAASEAQDESNIQTLAQNMNAIQASVAGLTSLYGSGDGTTGTPTGTGTGSTTTTTTTPPVTLPGDNISTDTVQGAGYWGGSPSASTPVTTPGGTVYDYISSWTNAQAIQESGGPVDFQSAPGVFTSAYGSNGQLLPALTQPGEASTPLYTVGSPNG